MPLNHITQISGKAVPVPGPDMDTDRIIPARFLKCITFDELAGKMFWDERFDQDGHSVGHPIDNPRHTDAAIIFGGENFGCGSSREHAPQAIKRSGIRGIVAESFAEIFFGNSTGIGLPCVTLSHENLETAMRLTEEQPSLVWAIDLTTMQLHSDMASFPIDMPDEPREALMQGRWDAVSELLNAVETVATLSAKLPVLRAQ